MQTNWIVITGVPSSGKTTLINQLSEAGYSTLPDPARVVYERYADAEKMPPDVTLQTEIVEFLARSYREMDPDELFFLDYGMPDNVVYQESLGLDTASSVRYCEEFRYKQVFLLAPLEFQFDGTRDKDYQYREEIFAKTAQKYEYFGYHLNLLPRDSASGLMERILRIMEKNEIID
jgi:predicted ATPase